MVPLVGGGWGEAKLAAVGGVVADRGADGKPAVRAADVSYCARLADAEAFGRAMLPEAHRRGVEAAGTVAAVDDGSVWIQGLVDLHRPDAVRILDVPHAVGYLNAAAQACWGEGSPAAVAWLDQQATELKGGDPDAVLGAVALLPADRAPDPAAAEQARDERWATCARGAGKSATPPSGARACRSARAWSRAATSAPCRRGSRAPGCTGDGGT
jgi:hypothetical protein